MYHISIQLQPQKDGEMPQSVERATVRSFDCLWKAMQTAQDMVQAGIPFKLIDIFNDDE